MSSLNIQNTNLEQLKADLRLKHGLKLLEPDAVKTASGHPTGWKVLDRFVASGGFPCGEISLLEGEQGQGAMTLWLESAALLTRGNQRVAWLSCANEDRDPFSFHAPAAHLCGVDLDKLFLVETPTRQLRPWILQELLASQLFSLVGCDLGEAHIPLRECRSLLMQARRSGAAVVLFSRRRTLSSREPPNLQNTSAIRALASVVLNFSQQIEIVRAAHRPVPHILPRRNRHVEFITTSASLDHALAIAPADRTHAGFGDRCKVF